MTKLTDTELFETVKNIAEPRNKTPHTIFGKNKYPEIYYLRRRRCRQSGASVAEREEEQRIFRSEKGQRISSDSPADIFPISTFTP